jgi:hypothetical protein
MTYDPNNPQAEAAPEAGAQMVDPVTGQPIGPTATMSFAEWCAVDPALVDADKAEFDRLYPVPPEPPEAPVVEGTTVAPTVADSAFLRFFGPSAEQKMDRATLDLRMQTLVDQPDPPPPPEPPAA